jgi:cellulose biosynthesis protein BcsQ
MAKVVLATGVEQLDNDIARELAGNGVEVAGECYYLEGIMPCCIQRQADTVIISPELAGSSSLEEVIIALRRSPLDIRVILLPGPEDLDDPRDLAGSVIGAGVYDIVFSTASSAGSKVNASEVAGRVLAPATYAEAEALLTSGVGMPHGNSFIVKGREQEQIDDAPLRVKADTTGSAAVQADGKGEKRLRSFGLDNILSAIHRISNRQKGAEHEPLTGDRESGGELTWGVEEAWDPPMGKADGSEQDNSADARSITDGKELTRDALSEQAEEELACGADDESAHGETVEKDKEGLALDASSEKNEEDMAWEDPTEKAGEEERLNCDTEEEQALGEDGTESLGDWEVPDESVPENDYQNQAQEHRAKESENRQRQNTRRWPSFQARKTVPEKRDLCYLPHQLIAVWSPDGWAKSYTAFNLAALAAAKGFDTALINYDVHCPELDTWFGVKQTGIGDFEEHGAGMLTFGNGFKPESVSRFLKKRAWGIRYLPAGNKLGNICTPGLDTEALEQTLKIVYQRNAGGKPAITIVDAGRSYEHASTMAALRQAAIVLIPTDGSPVIAEVTKQQIEELNRLGHSPRFIEVLFTTPGRKVFHICQERCSVTFDWMTYLIDRTAMKPQCLRADGRRAWEGVLNQLAPSGAGSILRRL